MVLKGRKRRVEPTSALTALAAPQQDATALEATSAAPKRRRPKRTKEEPLDFEDNDGGDVSWNQNSSVRVKRNRNVNADNDDDDGAGIIGTKETNKSEGEKLFQRKEYRKAIESFSLAIDTDKRHPDQKCLVWRSKCHLKMGNEEKALVDAEASLGANSNYVHGLLIKAQTLFEIGDFEFALVNFHRGNKLRPELEIFRVGIQICEEVIMNSVGNPDDKFTLEGDLTFLDSVHPQIRFMTEDEKKRKENVNKSYNAADDNEDDNINAAALTVGLNRNAHNAAAAAAAAAALAAAAGVERGGKMRTEEEDLGRSRISPIPQRDVDVFASANDNNNNNDLKRCVDCGLPITANDNPVTLGGVDANFNGAAIRANANVNQNHCGMCRRPQKKVKVKDPNVVRVWKQPKTCKMLLGDLYKDRAYLNSLLVDGDLVEATYPVGKSVRREVVAAINYLDAKADFWQKYKPIYARIGASRGPEKKRLVGEELANQIQRGLEDIDLALQEERWEDCLSKSRLLLATSSKWNPLEITNKRLIISALHNYMGVSYTELGRFDRGLREHLMDLEEMGKPPVLVENKSRALENMGRVYAKMGNYPKALHSWQQKEPLCKNEFESVWVCHEIGRTLLDMGNFVRSKQYGEKSYQFAIECNDKNWMLHASVLTAQSEAKMGDFDGALQTFSRSVWHAKDLGDQDALDAIYKAMADVKMRMERNKMKKMGKEEEEEEEEGEGGDGARKSMARGDDDGDEAGGGENDNRIAGNENRVEGEGEVGHDEVWGEGENLSDEVVDENESEKDEAVGYGDVKDQDGKVENVNDENDDEFQNGDEGRASASELSQLVQQSNAAERSSAEAEEESRSEGAAEE